MSLKDYLPYQRICCRVPFNREPPRLVFQLLSNSAFQEHMVRHHSET